MPLFTLTSHLVFQFGVAHTPTYIQKLQRLQNKAIRIISNASRKNSVTPLYKKYGVLKLADLFNYEMAKIMYQFSKQTLPSHLNCLFAPLSTVDERCTRSKTKQNLYILKFSISRCQNSFKYQGSKIWNSVTTDLRQQTFRKFKINYKNLLLKSYHYASLMLVFSISVLSIINFFLLVISNERVKH